jgi:hypothetical protein
MTGNARWSSSTNDPPKRRGCCADAAWLTAADHSKPPSSTRITVTPANAPARPNPGVRFGPLDG